MIVDLEGLAQLDLLVGRRLHLPKHHRHELVEVDRSVPCNHTSTDYGSCSTPITVDNVLQFSTLYSRQTAQQDHRRVTGASVRLLKETPLAAWRSG